MILYLCRHGIADDGEPGQDAERALTPEGIHKFRKGARGFLSLKPEITHVLSSPLTRARQTAEILVEVLKKENLALKIEITECLGDAPNLPKLLAIIDKLKDCRGVAAVGHEPTLSQWIGQLCFGSPGRCEMKKGAIAAIDLGRTHQGTLLFLLQPAQLRALA